MVMDSAATKTLRSSFEKGPYGATTAMAQIFQSPNGKLQLQLSAFNENNGPDLKVYLSKEIMPVNFINPGELKSTNGNQVYDIEGEVDLKVYKYACIRCKSYNHLFGYALLK